MLFNQKRFGNQYCGEVNSFRSFSKMQAEETYDLREGEGSYNLGDSVAF